MLVHSLKSVAFARRLATILRHRQLRQHLTVAGLPVMLPGHVLLLADCGSRRFSIASVPNVESCHVFDFLHAGRLPAQVHDVCLHQSDMEMRHLGWTESFVAKCRFHQIHCMVRKCLTVVRTLTCSRSSRRVRCCKGMCNNHAATLALENQC